MRKLLILLSFLSVSGAVPARAETEWRDVERWLGVNNNKSRAVWSQQTKFVPYLENGQHPHPQEWTKESWSASDWTQQRKNGLDLVSGFYRGDIIRNQSVEDGVAVVTVGPNFYRIGSKEKHRVIASIDDVYGVTAQNDQGVILLRDWHTRRDVGLFTKSGLTLQ